MSTLRTNVRNKYSGRRDRQHAYHWKVQSHQPTPVGACPIYSYPRLLAGNEPGGALEFVTVQPGDSLWDLADEHGPDQDPRDWIARVVQLNALESIELTPGQQIALP